MKTLYVILSRTILIGLLYFFIACVDKKKEDTNDAENLHEQEIHDELKMQENQTETLEDDEHMHHNHIDNLYDDQKPEDTLK